MPTKRDEVVDILRARIRSGEYRPGERIPPQRSLLQEFGISPVTLQRAIHRLSDQGFLETRGSAGTFLAAHPPDRACCALVFSQEPDSASWNRFYATLHQEAGRWDDGSGWRFEVCFAHPASTAHLRLCQRVQDGALAGLLFSSTPHLFSGSPLLAAPMPRVVIGEDPADRPTRADASILRLQTAGVLEALCAGFVAAGRRRLACIGIVAPVTVALAGMAIARRAGLDTRIEWWLGLAHTPIALPAARAIAHLLCSGRPEDRPDCLVIGDDNLVPAAVAGVLDAGLRVPGDIAIAAHANFPGPDPAGVPCRRFGYDARGILDLTVAEITRLRDGAARRTVQAPVTFADEPG